ncbi:MAG: two-component regulator propeller domain-containing protein, partial [Vicinamibacterales bacterium]
MTYARWCLAFLALAVFPVTADAAGPGGEPAGGSLDYSVASWDRNNGLPSGGITALLAAADGALWVGMDTGLYRFDGLRFVRSDAFRGPISLMTAAQDGSVWVALADGNVARIANGNVTRYDSRHGLPGAAATVLIEDPQRVLWLGTRRGLYRLVQDRWVATAPAGLPTALRVTGAAVDRAGDLLVSANNALFRRALNAPTFEQMAEFDTVGSANGICAFTSDRVYVTDPIKGFTVVGTPNGVTSSSRSVGIRVLCDTNDNVWIATGGGGLWRIPPSTGRTPPRVLTGMLGEVANSLAEDNRGNIWVGTPDGLTRLSPNPMVRLTDLGVTTAVATTADGHIWVGTFDGLVELTASGTGLRERRRYLAGSRVRALHADDAGRLWVATEHGVLCLDRTHATVTPVAGGAVPLKQVDSITSTRNGIVWLTDTERGLLRWDGAGVKPVNLPFDVRENPVNALHADRSGRIWLALEQGAAVINTDGHIDVYRDAGRGRTGRRSRSVLEDSRGVIWIGGADNLVWFSGQEHHVVTQADGFPVDLVKGLGEDQAGDIWIAGDAAIVRIARAEFERTPRDAAHVVRYTRFDSADGSGIPRMLGDRVVTKGPNGVLWFVTGNGITGVDPQ